MTTVGAMHGMAPKYGVAAQTVDSGQGLSTNPTSVPGQAISQGMHYVDGANQGETVHVAQHAVTPSGQHPPEPAASQPCPLCHQPFCTCTTFPGAACPSESGKRAALAAHAVKQANSAAKAAAEAAAKAAYWARIAAAAAAACQPSQGQPAAVSDSFAAPRPALRAKRAAQQAAAAAASGMASVHSQHFKPPVVTTATSWEVPAASLSTSAPDARSSQEDHQQSNRPADGSPQHTTPQRDPELNQVPTTAHTPRAARVFEPRTPPNAGAQFLMSPPILVYQQQGGTQVGTDIPDNPTRQASIPDNPTRQASAQNPQHGGSEPVASEQVEEPGRGAETRAEPAQPAVPGPDDDLIFVLLPENQQDDTADASRSHSGPTPSAAAAPSAATVATASTAVLQGRKRTGKKAGGAMRTVSDEVGSQEPDVQGVQGLKTRGSRQGKSPAQRSTPKRGGRTRKSKSDEKGRSKTDDDDDYVPDDGGDGSSSGGDDDDGDGHDSSEADDADDSEEEAGDDEDEEEEQEDRQATPRGKTQPRSANGTTAGKKPGRAIAKKLPAAKSTPKTKATPNGRASRASRDVDEASTPASRTRAALARQEVKPTRGGGKRSSPASSQSDTASEEQSEEEEEEVGRKAKGHVRVKAQRGRAKPGGRGQRKRASTRDSSDSKGWIVSDEDDIGTESEDGSDAVSSDQGQEVEEAQQEEVGGARRRSSRAKVKQNWAHLGRDDGDGDDSDQEQGGAEADEEADAQAASTPRATRASTKAQLQETAGRSRQRVQSVIGKGGSGSRRGLKRTRGGVSDESSASEAGSGSEGGAVEEAGTGKAGTKRRRAVRMVGDDDGDDEEEEVVAVAPQSKAKHANAAKQAIKSQRKRGKQVVMSSSDDEEEDEESAGGGKGRKGQPSHRKRLKKTSETAAETAKKQRREQKRLEALRELDDLQPAGDDAQGGGGSKDRSRSKVTKKKGGRLHSIRFMSSIRDKAGGGSREQAELDRLINEEHGYMGDDVEDSEVSSGQEGDAVGSGGSSAGDEEVEDDDDSFIDRGEEDEAELQEVQKEMRKMGAGSHNMTEPDRFQDWCTHLMLKECRLSMEDGSGLACDEPVLKQAAIHFRCMTRDTWFQKACPYNWVQSEKDTKLKSVISSMPGMRVMKSICLFRVEVDEDLYRRGYDYTEIDHDDREPVYTPHKNTIPTRPGDIVYVIKTTNEKHWKREVQPNEEAKCGFCNSCRAHSLYPVVFSCTPAGRPAGGAESETLMYPGGGRCLSRIKLLHALWHFETRLSAFLMHEVKGLVNREHMDVLAAINEVRDGDMVRHGYTVYKKLIQAANLMYTHESNRRYQGDLTALVPEAWDAVQGLHRDLEAREAPVFQEEEEEEGGGEEEQEGSGDDGDKDDDEGSGGGGGGGGSGDGGGAGSGSGGNAQEDSDDDGDGGGGGGRVIRRRQASSAKRKLLTDYDDDEEGDGGGAAGAGQQTATFKLTITRPKRGVAQEESSDDDEVEIVDSTPKYTFPRGARVSNKSHVLASPPDSQPQSGKGSGLAVRFRQTTLNLLHKVGLRQDAGRGAGSPARPIPLEVLLRHDEGDEVVVLDD